MAETTEPLDAEHTGRVTAVGENNPQAVQSAPQRDRGTLLMLAGPEPGAVYPMSGVDLLIGRDPSVQLPVSEASVSRRHVRVLQRDGEFFAEDLGSVNGTYIDGLPLQGCQRLLPGSRLQLGRNVMFRFDTHDALEQEMLRGLYHSAVHDPLTRIYNRRHFDERLSAELSHAQRHRRDLSLLMIDVDHFKNVNDTHGHSAGDAVLRVLGAVLQRVTRPEDLLVRYGGEEFCVVARETDRRNAMVLAQRIRRMIAELTVPYQGHDLRVTVSVGIASLDDLGSKATPEQLITAADEALYRAKHEGRNSCQLFTHEES